MNRKEADKRYAQSTKGKERKKEYLARSGKYITSAKYLSKPFIAIGGVATLDEDGQHVYAHLRLSTGEHITNLNGLTTEQIATFIMANTPPTSEAILVSYNGTYDWNYWAEALNLEQLKTIYGGNYRTKPITIGYHRLRLNPGQSITFYDIWQQNRTINEVQNFYQVPLDQAVKEYLNKDIPGGSKYYTAVKPENLAAATRRLDKELKLTAELMAEFRRRLDRVNLRPRRWSGSGSITTNLFERHNIKAHMATLEPGIAALARYAYAGGRFEIIQYGHTAAKPSYQYDINSAYPEALTKLPSLSGGRWHSIAGDPGDTDYGLYKITIKAKKAHLPHPLFNRDYNGAISYPRTVTGWYWSPEIKTVRKWAELGYGTYEIDEAVIYEPASDYKPFAWIADIYNQRLELQRRGDNAETGLKLVLNTAYGKLAQQVGYMPADEKHPAVIPPYHQIEYAGYVTSYTRAKIYEAALERLDLVIAFETDALYTQYELYNIPLGDQLGEYRETKYKELTYINSGIYFGIKDNGEQVYKLRGLQPGTLTLDEITKALEQPEAGRIIKVAQRRFISAAQIAETNSLDNWRKWHIQDLELKLYPIGKRIHYLCSCKPTAADNLFIGGWHTTVPAKPYKKMNQYSIAWINPELAQLHTRQTGLIDKSAII